MIRPATLADVASCVDVGERFHAQSGFADFAPFDEETFAKTLTLLVTGHLPGGMFVVERDQQIVGIAAFVLFPSYFNGAALAAQELFWFVEPEHRDGAGADLLMKMELAAQAAGASIFIMAALSTIKSEAMARVFRRRGYRALESTYIRSFK